MDADAPRSAADLDPSRRRQLYLRTTVEAEIGPGTPVDLSGPDAVADWPFPSHVHVITAWNPFGRPRPLEQNTAAHERLVAQLAALDVDWVPAVGREQGGSYGEPGVLTTDLDDDTACRIAAAHDQEAVFRIDAADLWVVSVADGHAVGRPRGAHRRRA